MIHLSVQPIRMGIRINPNTGSTLFVLNFVARCLDFLLSLILKPFMQLNSYPYRHPFIYFPVKILKTEGVMDQTVHFFK